MYSTNFKKYISKQGNKYLYPFYLSYIFLGDQKNMLLKKKKIT